MILKVFSTKREIREFVKKSHDGFLPKLCTIGEFFEKSIKVPGFSRVDSDLKKVYLYRAMENVGVSPLGIRKDFLSVFKSSETVFSFFKELFNEKASFEDVLLGDVYGEYEEHVEILKKIYENYASILKKERLFDDITVDEYEINKGFFEGIKRVEIHLQGYLSKRDLEIIRSVPCDVYAYFRVSAYNRPLVEKMFGALKEGEYVFDIKKNTPLEFKKLPKPAKTEVYSFSDRITQSGFVFASIEELVNKGISPDNIAVILPDEGYAEYLRVLDRHNNLNFAMGEPFVNSTLFIMLEAVFKYITEKDALSFAKASKEIGEFEKIKSFEGVLEFVLKHATLRERKLIDEEIYKISRLSELKKHPKEEVLKFILQRFEKLSFDDVKGGRVTVMGVLESRGMEFEGVIIPDFSDSFVPSVGDADFFLNTAVRKRASLPTRREKEALQKNYYYNILLNAKHAKISYIKNEKSSQSRFLSELGLEESKSGDVFYKNVINREERPSFYTPETTFEPPKTLTPTLLKTLIACPMKYYYSYVLKIKNEQKEVFGTGLHDAIAKALTPLPSSKEEYFERIMQNILKDADRKKIFEIRSQWEDKIKAFAHRDFEELDGDVLHEKELPSRKYKNYILKARPDRIVSGRIYDYKTSRSQDYLKDTTQAEFYAFLSGEEEVYFWDIYNVKLIKLKPDVEKLKEKIDSLSFLTKRAEERSVCRYCEYAFACLNPEL